MLDGQESSLFKSNYKLTSKYLQEELKNDCKIVDFYLKRWSAVSTLSNFYVKLYINAIVVSQYYGLMYPDANIQSKIQDYLPHKCIRTGAILLKMLGSL